MDETKRLDYTLNEYQNLIEETKMQINVIRQNKSESLETRLIKINDLERKIELLKKDILKPYFARIDFKNDNDIKDICYIGKNGVINNDDEIITVDWRAPISSLYYDSNIGKTSYEAPEGIINGDLLLKRQYEIENSKLISYNDVDIVSNDEILKPYLNVNSDNRLKNIVASIQSEQNEIIRKRLWDNIVVQGVAGSGKTTVALHRVAYLVYNYRENIKPDQYIIIGPNKFFINYISNVLPDLDVDNVKQLDFISFAKEVLNEKFDVVDYPDNESTYFKTSLKYRDIIDKYIFELDKRVIPNDNLSMYGFDILNSKIIREIYDKSETNFDNINSKVEKCILLVEKYINNIKDQLLFSISKYMDDLFEKENNDLKKKDIIKKREEIKTEINNNCHNLLKRYFKIVNEKIINLYYEFLINIDRYIENEITLSYFNKDISLLKNKKIEYEDLAALIYFKYKINGNFEYMKYKQVVVDEAQDYNEFVFFVLKKIFSNASFSIFGDLAQSIYPYRSIEDFNCIKEKIMDCNIINLRKSYRTSIEIMNEANKINRYLNLNEAEPVIRHGEKPKYYKIDNYDFILKEINKLVEKGYKTIALISKEEIESNNLYNYLKDKIKVINIDDKTSVYDGGICCVTSTLCKGLEFDAVIINEADNEVFNPNNKIDMRLLYVSMTRPLHELIITYKNDLTSVLI